jgi:two-component system nitrogen regulation response regulator NtrX
LRERRRDIPLLVKFLVARLCAKHNLRPKKVDAEALHELEQHSWPGNVRELQNLLERVLIMSGERITVLDLPEDVLALADAADSKYPAQSSLKECRDQAERELILDTLKKHAGNISRTAIELHIRRPYLHRRMSALGISKKDYFGG